MGVFGRVKRVAWNGLIVALAVGVAALSWTLALRPDPAVEQFLNSPGPVALAIDSLRRRPEGTCNWGPTLFLVTLSADVLYSQSPDGIRQEIAARRTALNVIRTVRLEAAATARIEDPLRISFVHAVRAIPSLQSGPGPCAVGGGAGNLPGDVDEDRLSHQSAASRSIGTARGSTEHERYPSLRITRAQWKAGHHAAWRTAIRGCPRISDFREVRSQGSLARAESTISTQVSAPRITAHRVMTRMASSLCRLLRSARGSGVIEKCSQVDAAIRSLLQGIPMGAPSVAPPL